MFPFVKIKTSLASGVKSQEGSKHFKNNKTVLMIIIASLFPCVVKSHDTTFQPHTEADQHHFDPARATLANK